MENVFRFQVLDSTNAKAISIAKEGLSEAVVIAKRQTGGRGLMGRSFASPEGGLYLSYLTDRLAPGASVLALTPAAALAARRAILRTFDLSCGIKYEKAEDPRSLQELERNLIEELDAVIDTFAAGGSLNEAEYRRYCVNCPETIVHF